MDGLKFFVTSVKTVCVYIYKCFSVEAVKLLDQAAPSATKMEGRRGSNKQFGV